MDASHDFLLVLHQFILGFLGLFFVYFAWRYQVAGTFDRLSRISGRTVFAAFIGVFIALFSLFIKEWGPEMMFFSFFLALLITLGLFDPKFAVSLFIFLLISRPWEFFNTPLMMSMPRDLFVLTMLSFLAQKIIRKQFYFRWNFACTLIFFYAAWTFFSIIPSQNAAHAFFQFDEVFIKGIIVFIMIVNVVDKKEYIMPIQIALVFAISEKSILSFYKSQILKIVADGERLTSVGILENSNDIAAIMILAIPFTLRLFNEIKPLFVKVILSLSVFGFYSFLVWESKSRGAVLAIGALVIAWMWLKAKNKKLASIIVISGLVLSIFAVTSIKRNAEDIEGSTSNRKIYWTAAVNMAIRNPIFGVGYANFPYRLMEFTNGHVGTEGKHKTAHSTWLLALAESGFMGFIFYVGLWFTAIKGAWRMKESHPQFFLGLVAYGTAITFLSHTYMLYPYILLGLIIAAEPFYSVRKIQPHVVEEKFPLLVEEYS